MLFHSHLIGIVVGEFIVARPPVEIGFENVSAAELVVVFPRTGWLGKLWDFLYPNQSNKMVMRFFGDLALKAMQFKVRDRINIRGSLCLFKGRVKLSGGKYLMDSSGQYITTTKCNLIANQILD